MLSALVVFQFVSVAAQNSQWYNWYEDNRDKQTIENGVLPTLSCPYGYYRQFKSVPHEPGGINLDGCMKCPLGVYGNATNLNSPDCTAPCPLGTYNDEEGVSSIEDCKPCPPGTYGKGEGMITAKCSGSCSDRNRHGEQFYSIHEGLESLEGKPDKGHTNVLFTSELLLLTYFSRAIQECDICPIEYNYYLCQWDVDFVTDTRQTNRTYHATNDWELEAAVQIPVIWEYIW